MLRAVNLASQQSEKLKQFQKFVFIGDSANNSAQQSPLATNKNLLTQDEEAYLLITQIHTSNDITHQLKNLQIKTGAIVKLISKTKNGSVVVSINNQLIGIGAQIANHIAVVPASQTK